METVKVIVGMVVQLFSIINELLDHDSSDPVDRVERVWAGNKSALARAAANDAARQKFDAPG